MLAYAHDYELSYHLAQDPDSSWYLSPSIL